MSVMLALIVLLHNVLISQLFLKNLRFQESLRSIKGYNSVIISNALLDIASFIIFNILKT